MPLINEYKVKNKASFKKKNYRPWNIEGEKPTNIASGTENDHKVSNIVEFSTSHPNDLIEEQTENKKETISTQTAVQTENLKYTNREQAENISETSIKHIGDKEETISTLFRKQILNESSHEQLGYLPPIEIKSDALRRLCGHQRKLLFYIVNQCVLRGQLSSGPTTTEALAEVIGANGMTVKTSIQRLIGKGFFIRENGKVGRGGFSNFLISEALRNAVMEELQQLNFGKQIGNNWITKQETTPLCSSSILNNTTTTGSVQNMKLPEDWEGIDVEPLDFIKFTKNHLIQLFKTEKLTSEIVQNSIEAFAFDLEHNNKGNNLKVGPLNFFMGILRKGEPYLPPENYESSQDKAMRLYIQKQHELEARRLELEKEALNIAFEDWKSKLDVEQLGAICPPEYLNDEESPFRNGFLKIHFEKELWPEIKKLKILGQEKSYVK